MAGKINGPYGLLRNASGDALFSPYEAAGWSIAEQEHSVRLAPWLGLLKVLGIWGAEVYYAGFFSVAWMSGTFEVARLLARVGAQDGGRGYFRFR
jgi:hypothetical protein